MFIKMRCGGDHRDELPLAGERRLLHHVVLEVLDGGNSKTLRLLNEYTVRLTPLIVRNTRTRLHKQILIFGYVSYEVPRVR